VQARVGGEEAEEEEEESGEDATEAICTKSRPAFDPFSRH
jgi:hypothetical protein